jgi:coproporphyrinogen III oxidase-like Fe-S oxidoreductase
MAPRDPSKIKRDENGHFAAVDSRSLAEGLGRMYQQRQKKKKVSSKEKAVLNTIMSGEDKLGDSFESAAEIMAVAQSLEQQGLIANDGTGFVLTDAGVAAIAKKKSTKRRRRTVRYI